MPPSRRPRLVLAICCTSVVVVVMDIAMVNVALPSMRRDLHAPSSRRSPPALAGMPGSMAAPAASLPSAARQVGTAVGVAVSGTMVAASLTGGWRAVWWPTRTLGIAVLVLALGGTGHRAVHSAARAAALFDEAGEDSG